jgi:anti-sigma B factor antagonist
VTENNTPNIDVAVERIGYVVVASVSGEVDMLTAPALRQVVDEQIGDCRVLVIDLSGVSFLGSAGLAVLVETSHEAKRREVLLRLVTSSHTVRRPLEITGLTDMLTTFPTLDEAVDAPV